MKQLSRYLAVGVLNTGVGYLIIFGCMYGLHWSPQASNVAGYAIGLATSYGLNRTFTFRSANRWVPEFVRFICIFLISFGANFQTLAALLAMGVHAAAAQLIAGIAYVVASYLLNRTFVFRRASAAES